VSITKTSAHVFWTLRKHTTWLFVKSFGECCGCKVLTDACYWPSSNCIPAQTFLCVSRELNHNHSLVLDSHNGVCFHHSCSVYSISEVENFLTIMGRMNSSFSLAGRKSINFVLKFCLYLIMRKSDFSSLTI